MASKLLQLPFKFAVIGVPRATNWPV
jgi:hypothetical protein